MGGRTRFFLLIVIMSVVVFAAGGVTLALLYDTAIEQQRTRLRETAQSRARLIEAVAEYDLQAHAKQYPSDKAEQMAYDATLGQIRTAHKRFEGFGDTGEFTLAKRDGDAIAFLLRHRWDAPDIPQPVPLGSGLAEPMRLALRGESGTLVGYDYRGVKVLAAHEPVDVLDLGIVAKIDLAEVRAPFFKAGAVAGGMALLLIFVGAGLFVRVGNPIIRQLEDRERDLRRELSERAKAELALRRIEWMLSPEDVEEASYEPPYGDLTELNTSRLILDSVGKDLLGKIAKDYISILGTSGAIYESNGDYALGIFSSGWCQFADSAAYAQCGMEPAEAQVCGQWHCHDSCWQDSCKAAMDSGEPVDIKCAGGINLYAVPIRAGEEIIGAMNVGWGDPPTDDESLRKIAEKYGVCVEELRKQALAYESRPPFLVALAKRRLETAAVLIGEIVQRHRAEAELMEQKRFLQTLIDGIPSPIFWKSADGIYRGCNQSFCERLGRSADELIGRGVYDLFPKDLADVYRAADRELFESPGRQEYEGYIRHVSGSKVPVLYQKATYLGTDGDVAGLVGVATDISGLKRTEDALRISERRFSEAQRIARMGDFTWDTGTGEVTWSDALFELLGYDRSEEMDYGKVNALIHHPEDMEDVEQWLKECIASDADVLPPNEYRLIRKDHTVMHVRTQGVVRRREGKPPTVIGTVVDITDRVESERAMRESERRLSTLMSNLPGTVYRCLNDSDWTAEFVSDGSLATLGYKSEDLVGKDGVSFAGLIHPDDRQIVWDTIQHALSRREVFECTYRIRRADGKERWLWEQGQGIYDEDGQVVAIEGYLSDITERKQAEIELARTRSRLEEAQEIAHLGSFEYVAATRTTVWSAEECRIFGVDPAGPSPSYDEMLRDFVYPEDVDLLNETLMQAMQSRSVFELEHRIVRPDGTLRWIYSRAQPHLDAQGEIDRYIGVSLDITDRKQAEEKLRRSEELLNEVGRIAHIGGWEHDLTTGEARWTRGTYDIVEILPDDPIPGPEEHLDYYPPEDREILRAAYQRSVETGEPFDVEVQCNTATGRIFWARAIGQPVLDGDKCIKMKGTFQDITERKRSEQALVDSENRYRLLANNTVDVIWKLDLDMRFTYVNPAIERAFGYTEQEWIGELLACYSDSDDFAFMASRAREAVEQSSRDQIVFESYIRHKDGRKIPVEISGVVIYDGNGTPQALQGTTRDISERRRVEEELTRYRERLEELVAERTAELEIVHEKLLKQERLATLGHLTATVSHELRNPLGTIRTSLFMIGERVRGGEPALDDEISRAERGIVRCNRIIEELLDFVRAKDITRQETAIDSWLDGVLDEEKLPSDVVLERVLSAGISVSLDRERLRRAVVNIVTNAWQAMQENDPSGGTLRVETLVVGRRLEMRFSDTGPGVLPEDSERIMEPLYSTKGFGVGLGLPIVRQIMDLHGGGLEMDSVVGEGTTATLWLPLEY